MDLLTPQILAPVISQLGLSVVFLWLFVRKDKKLEEKNDQVLQAFQENTKVQENLMNAIKANTDITNKNITVTDKIYDALTNR